MMPTGPKTTSPTSAMGRAELAGVALDVLAPVVAYYALHGAGFSEWVALLAGAAVPAARAGYTLIRRRRLNWLPIAVLTVIAVSIAVSFVAGSPRFLLAKDGIVKAAIGVAILATLPAKHPIMFTVSRTFVSMAGHSPSGWDEQWESSARFRKIWRMITGIWGAGVIASAAAKMVFAYTLPIDVVPAISLAQWVVLLVGLNVVTQLYLRRPPNKTVVFDRTAPTRRSGAADTRTL